MAAIGVIGSGTWGTALAILLVQNHNQVALWSAFAEEADKIRTEKKHPNLPEAVIPEELEITADLQAAMEGKEILVLAVPSIFVRQTAAKMAPFCRQGQIIVNVAKGIEEQSLKPLSEVIEEELPMADVAVLSGPSHAEEVSRLLPTTCVAGAHKRETAEKIQAFDRHRTGRGDHGRRPEGQDDLYHRRRRRQQHHPLRGSIRRDDHRCRPDRPCGIRPPGSRRLLRHP